MVKISVAAAWLCTLVKSINLRSHTPTRSASDVTMSASSPTSLKRSLSRSDAGCHDSSRRLESDLRVADSERPAKRRVLLASGSPQSTLTGEVFAAAKPVDNIDDVMSDESNAISHASDDVSMETAVAVFRAPTPLDGESEAFDGDDLTALTTGTRRRGSVAESTGETRATTTGTTVLSHGDKTQISTNDFMDCDDDSVKSSSVVSKPNVDAAALSAAKKADATLIKAAERQLRRPLPYVHPQFVLAAWALSPRVLAQSTGSMKIFKELPEDIRHSILTKYFPIRGRSVSLMLPWEQHKDPPGSGFWIVSESQQGHHYQGPRRYLMLSIQIFEKG